MLTDTKKTAAANEFPKMQSHMIVEIVEYIPDAVMRKTVINKTGGEVTATSVYEGEELCEKSYAFDSYVQIIDGKAKVTIDKEELELKLGEGIVIPADVLHCFKADEQFKMITTLIKHIY